MLKIKRRAWDLSLSQSQLILTFLTTAEDKKRKDTTTTRGSHYTPTPSGVLSVSAKLVRFLQHEYKSSVIINPCTLTQISNFTVCVVQFTQDTFMYITFPGEKSLLKLKYAVFNEE